MVFKIYKNYEETNENALPPLDNYKSNVIVSNEIVKNNTLLNHQLVIRKLN